MWSPFSLSAQDQADLEVRELLAQPVKGAVFLDLRGDDLETTNEDLPSWVESLQRLEPDALPLEMPDGMLFHLAARNEPDAIWLRLLFQYAPDLLLQVKVYDEDFTLLRSEMIVESDSTASSDLKSKSVWLPEQGIRYLLLTSNRPGSLRSAFLNLVQSRSIWASEEYAAAKSPLTLFRSKTALPSSDEDLELYGRIRAELMREAEPLSEGDALEFEVALEELPLLSVLHFQMEGINPAKPVLVDINGRGPFPVHYALPDLADPMYVGRIKQVQDGMSFQYLGQVEAKVVFPEKALRLAAPNVIRFYLPQEHPEVSISQVLLELKYPWRKFTYTLEP